jgi:folate-binding Fe-S cluster repair protein YgfZ
LEADAISYDKGCYLGQEVVARVHFRGHVNRRLCGLAFGTDGAVPGDALYEGEKEVGRVTSAVRSPEFGPIGLGYVRREIEPPAELSRAGGGVSVIGLPFRRPGV